MIAHSLLILVPPSVATVLVIIAAGGSDITNGNSVPTTDQLRGSDVLSVGLITGCGDCLLQSIFILVSAVLVRRRAYKLQEGLPHLQGL